MSILTPTRGLLLTGTAILLLGGCAATTQHAANPRTPAPVDENVAALLAQNALYSGNTIRLGAGDRFGDRVHDHYVMLVHARQLHEQMVAEVADDAR